MEKQPAELRKKIAEAEARAKDGQRRWEESQSKTSSSISKLVPLEATLDHTTKPARQPFPRSIVPWDDFPTLQEKIWETLSLSSDFNTRCVYPSYHQLEFVQRYIDPSSPEFDIRYYAQHTAEIPVQTLFKEVHKDEQLRRQLQLQGTMAFNSYTMLGRHSEISVEKAVEHMDITESTASRTGTTGKKIERRGQQISAGWNGARTAERGCIYQLSDGQKIPVVLIEYISPLELPLAPIAAGLKGEIRPAEEVINKEGHDFEFLAKSLAAAVITRLFSCMIRKGIQWGYVFVGVATIFLYIPDDPTTVRYHLSIPHLDVQEGDGNGLHRTSVAQIFAFFLSALVAEAPSQSWHDAAASLNTWAVDYIDILEKIRETERNKSHKVVYEPSRWKGFVRSPIQICSRCLVAGCSDSGNCYAHGNSGDESGGSDTPPTQRTTSVQREEGGAQRRGLQGGERKKSASHSSEKKVESALGIKGRPFCTQQCLLGLAHGGDLDNQCPNLRDHGERHIPPSTFLSLIRAQLAIDRGRDADCKPLHMKGSRGALFKVRLSSHGYTLVAKGMEKVERKYLVHESTIYDHLRPIQGNCIPVSLGIVDLELPYYYDAGIYLSMLFLSWAGRSIQQRLTRENGARILDQVDRTLGELHGRRVLHKDAEPRNWLWDEQHGRLMLVDFERAEIRDESPLGIISPNRKGNRQRNSKSKVKKDGFYREMQGARALISRYISDSQ